MKITKHLLQFITALLITLCGSAFAQTTLTIDDVDFDAVNGKISSYKGTAKNIIIPESFIVDGVEYPIYQIGTGSFDYQEIESVVFPETLQFIGSNAFMSNNISELTIPEGCQVGTQAFQNNMLTAITIPATMTEIPNDCFGFNNITALYIPPSVTSIGDRAFESNRISSLTLPEGLKTIGQGAFESNAISSVVIPNSVTDIGALAFKENKLTNITLNEDTRLEGSVFPSNAIDTVNGNPHNGLFYATNEDGTTDYTKLTCYGGDEKIVDFLPDAITVIGQDAFSHAPSDSIVFPPALTYIGIRAFHQSNIGPVTFPNTLEYIAASAFRYSKLDSIVLPKSIRYIGSDAFAHAQLRSLSFEDQSNIQFIGRAAFDNYLIEKAPLLPTNGLPGFIDYYDEEGTRYETGSEIIGNSNYIIARSSKMLTLDDVGFDETTGTILAYTGLATDITIPESFTIGGKKVPVKVIGIAAFEDKNLFSVEMGNSITTIGGYAFADNPFMENLVLSKGLISIKTNAFINSVPESGIILPETGVWHGASGYLVGTEVTEIGNTRHYYHLVYTVDFLDYDGTVLKNLLTVHGKSAYPPKEPIREGYTFTGWNMQFGSIVADTTVTALYQINTYTVQFKDWDGRLLKSEVVEHGSSAAAPDAPTREDHQFTGWDSEFESITGSTTITAQYRENEKLVQFVDWDGTLLKHEYVERGFAATAPETPKRTGYTFTGWDINFTVITADTTITAEYGINTYTVTFEDWNGTVIKSEEVEYKAAATAPESPERTGYTFSGWDTSFDLITANKTLTAQYDINTYTATFSDWDGTVLSTAEVEYNSFATAPEAPERIGYTFTGWDIDFSAVTADTTVTATYEINTYTVTFEDWNGTVIKSEDVQYSAAATAPDNPERTGYTFTGWDTGFDLITANTAAVAVYEINTYTVTFTDWDGTVISTEEVAYNSPATAPNAPSRTGFTFSNWDIDFDAITADTTVTAEYTAGIYTVKFEDYDGALIKSESVEYNSSASAPESPVRTGYTFTGWDIDFSTITADTTVTAVYEINTYTVTFNDWDGTVIKSEEVEYLSAATAPDTPERKGYMLSGWSMDLSAITANITVTAQYETGIYSVTFKDYDGSVLKTETVEYLTAATAPVPPSRTGYRFTGWDIRFDFITADTTVTAKYAVRTYTVSFVNFDGSLIASITAKHGSAASAPEIPERPGYTFTGWDSAFENVTGDLTVTATYEILSSTILNTVSAVACGSYTLNNATFTKSTVHESYYKTASGADSVVTMHLTIYPEYGFTKILSVDYNETYQLGSQLLTQSGEYIETFSTVRGCDSIITMRFMVRPPKPVYNNIAVTACGSFKYKDTVFTESTEFKETYTTAIGGDSIVTLSVTINPEYTISDKMDVAYGETYRFGSQFLTKSGKYTETFTSAAGCDSTVTLVFKVLPPEPVFHEISETSCGPFTYDDSTFTESTVYVSQYKAANGADSTVTLTLTVNPGYTVTDEKTVAYGETYQFGAQLLSQTGEYTETFSSVAGCDSTVNLSFTVKRRVITYNISGVTCGSYTYGDTTFTESTVYEKTYVTDSGADSIVTLTLTVAPEYSVTDEKTISYGETYQFGSQLLSQTGEYTETFSTVSGCDSTVTLTLTVTGTPAVKIINSETTIAIDENTPQGTVVLSVLSNLPDETVFGLTDASGAFTIDTQTGEVSVLDASVLDYESVKEISFSASATAGDGSAEQSFTVTLNDVADEVSVLTGTMAVDVYPTIVSHTVTVSAPILAGELMLVSEAGIVIYSAGFSETATVNLTDVPSGTYIVRLQSQNGFSAHKMIFVE